MDIRHFLLESSILHKIVLIDFSLNVLFRWAQNFEHLANVLQLTWIHSCPFVQVHCLQVQQQQLARVVLHVVGQLGSDFDLTVCIWFDSFINIITDAFTKLVASCSWHLRKLLKFSLCVQSCTIFSSRLAMILKRNPWTCQNMRKSYMEDQLSQMLYVQEKLL